MTPVRLGTVGVWSGRLQRLPTPRATAAVVEYEELGYGALWIPESPGGKDVLTFAAVLLGASRKLVVAAGIAIIWIRDPVAMVNASRTLADAFPGRFVLGVGVSHRSTAQMRGHAYAQPLLAMRGYLEKMDKAPFDGHPPDRPAPRLLAALGPRMTALAGELADGVHPFLSTPDHTYRAREILGPDKLVAVEQAIVPSKEAGAARSAARENLHRFLAWPNYRRHLLRLGFDQQDLADGGSNRLVDSVYAWGDDAAIRDRVADHLTAGADHVCVQVIPVEGRDELSTLRALAPTLISLQ